MVTGRNVTRWVVAIVPAIMALLFVRIGIDVFTTVKATTAVLAAIVVLAVGAVTPVGRLRGRPVEADAIRPGHVSLRVVLALLAVTIVVAALTAGSPLRALVGEAGRHSGAAVWLAALVLGVAASSAARRDGGRLLSVVTVAAVLPVGGYALAQALGADPFAWSQVEGGPHVFSTLGNTNFLSAWLGMVTPVAVALSLDTDREVIDRLIGLAAVPVGFGAAIASGSIQGPVAALVGTAVVVGVWATDIPWQRRSRALAAVTGLALVGAVVLLGLVDAEGSPQSLVSSVERSVETRTPLWSAAVNMAEDHPLTGVGPGHFVDDWFAARPADTAADPGVGDGAIANRAVANGAVANGAVGDRAAEEPPRLGGVLDRPVDDAHAVPLHLAATAGWPAAILLLAAVALIAGSAVGVLAGGRADPVTTDRLLPGGWLGAVTAAGVVAVVSVDVAPLTVTAAVLLGATHGAAQRARFGADHDPRVHGDVPWPVVAVIAVVAVTTAAAALVPLAADLVAGTAVAAGERNDVPAVTRRWEMAADFAPWERRYPARHSTALAQRGDLPMALQAQQQAVNRAPRNRTVLVDLARLTAAVEGAVAAVDPYTRALQADPHTPELLVEAARNALAADRPRAAVGLLHRAVKEGADATALADLIRGAEAAASSTGGDR